MSDSITNANFRNYISSVPFPVGVDENVWGRMCRLRREKIESELLVKTRALVLASMQDFLQKRLDEDEVLKDEIEVIIDDLNK